MKTIIDKSLGITVLIATFVGFPIHLRDAEAERGGFSRGSFRGGGESMEGSRGGEAAEGPRGGEAVEGPRGGEAAEDPRGGEAVEEPGGDVAVRGQKGNVAVGTRSTVLPTNANTVVVSGRTYYEVDGVYYQPYYVGADINYVVVEAPGDDSEDAP